MRKNEKVYYYRDNKKRPIITVCLAKDENGNVGRGISLCSHLDNPEKKEGRRIAIANARRALGTRKDGGSLYTNVKAVAVLLRTSAPPELYASFKSSYNPKLTEFEEKLLSKM